MQAASGNESTDDWWSGGKRKTERKRQKRSQKQKNLQKAVYFLNFSALIGDEAVEGKVYANKKQVIPARKQVRAKQD